MLRFLVPIIAASVATTSLSAPGPGAREAARRPAGAGIGIVRQEPVPPRRIDSLFAQYDRTSSPGCALGVYRAGQVVYARGYGMADLNQGVPIGPETVFYIASTSKQFTAFAVALLAERGRLSLDDPIRKWFPELPPYADRVTIRHLVHHTSGIRDYLGLWGLSGRAFADEIPAEVALDLIVRQRALDFEPGSRYSYSNSGYLLLALLVERVAGQSLRRFTEANLFGPLGMAATHFHDDNAMIVPQRAEGYQPAPEGRFAIVRTSFALVGDGGLLTTINDLARWDANFYDNRLGAGGPALIERVTTPGRLSDGSAQTYGFGLSVGRYRGLATVDHGGSFIGFRAQLLRFPAERLSVAVLCNVATADPERLAQQVAELYLADRLAPAAAAPAGGASGVVVAPERLAALAGSYQLLPGTVARVAAEGPRLVLSAFGNRIPLTAVSESVFTAAGLPGEIRFRTGAGGPALLATELGMKEPAPRLGPPPVLTAAAAAGYAGRYRSEELDTWAAVAPRGDTLRVRVRWGPWRVLEPIAPDVFGVAGSQVAFERDRRGRVNGYRVSAARTLNLGFVREPDRTER